MSPTVVATKFTRPAFIDAPVQACQYHLQLVDRSTLIYLMNESTETQKKNTRARPRQIVGISLSPEMAREVKAYAGENGLSLRKLFEDMWQTYKKRPVKGRP